MWQQNLVPKFFRAAFPYKVLTEKKKMVAIFFFCEIIYESSLFETNL